MIQVTIFKSAKQAKETPPAFKYTMEVSNMDYNKINQEAIADNARDIIGKIYRLAYEKSVTKEVAAMAFLAAALIDLKSTLREERTKQ